MVLINFILFKFVLGNKIIFVFQVSPGLIVYKKNPFFPDNILGVSSIEIFSKTLLFEFLNFPKPCYFAHSLFSKEPTKLKYHQVIFIL